MFAYEVPAVYPDRPAPKPPLRVEQTGSPWNMRMAIAADPSYARRRTTRGIEMPHEVISPFLEDDVGRRHVRY